MKDQNNMVKFRNRFAQITMQKVTSKTAILKDSLSQVTKQQLTSLIQLYTRDNIQNGFNSALAFRIILLYCYCSSQQSKNIKNFQLITELNRFFKNQLKQITQDSLQNIRNCMDLLMIDEVKRKVQYKYQRLFKIKVLAKLNFYYYIKRQVKDRIKSTNLLRLLCNQTLKNQKVKFHNEDIYCEILDILLELQDRQMRIKLSHNKLFEALQYANNMIRYLQNTQYSFKSQKYQEILMKSYWFAAILHYKMHYLFYTKKYLIIVVNIAKRLLENNNNNNINNKNNNQIMRNKQEENNQIYVIKKFAQDLLEKIVI